MHSVELIFTVACCFLILQVFRTIVGYYATRWIIATENQTLRKKVASDAWYSVYYGLAAVVGVLILYMTGWWNDLEGVCLPIDMNAATIDYPYLDLYHATQLAFYINYLYAMVVGIDNRRKDQTAFLIHHLVTVVLIVFSRLYGYMVIQLTVLALHDAADPFLHMAKTCKRIWPLRTWLSDVLLVIFAVVFFVTRWWIYPWYLIRNCYAAWNLQYPFDWKFTPGFADHRYSLCFGDVCASYFGFALNLLPVLYVLNLFWGCYILKMAWIKFVASPTGQKDDVNSDDDSDGGTEERPVEKKRDTDGSYAQVWPRPRRSLDAPDDT